MKSHQTTCRAGYFLWRASWVVAAILVGTAQGLAATRSPILTEYPAQSITEVPSESGFVSAALPTSADVITPDIQALADALGKDPIKIYEWVKNNIEYAPYRGLLRGARGTLVDRIGNDIDQSVLLYALLKAAGESPQYMQRMVSMPAADVGQWLGVQTDGVVDAIHRLNLWYLNKDLIVRTGNYVSIERFWVMISKGAVQHHLDPAFKRYEWPALLLLTDSTSYNRDSLLDHIGGNVSGPGVTMSNSNKQSLVNKLNQYTSEMIAHGAALHSESGAEFAGQKRLIKESYTSLPVAFPYSIVSSNTVAHPFSYQSEVYLQGWPYKAHPEWMTTFLSMATWQLYHSGRIRFEFPGGRLRCSLGDDVKWSDIDISSDYVPIMVSYIEKTTNGTRLRAEFVPAALKNAGSYLLSWSLGASKNRLRAAQLEQSSLVAAGLNHEEHPLRTKNMEIAGLQYFAQSEFVNSIATSTGGVIDAASFFTAVVGRPNNSFYIDIPGGVQRFAPKANLSQAAGDALIGHFYGAIGFVGSALEHVLMEQVTGVRSVSMSRMAQRSVELGDTVYLAKSSADYSQIVPNLLNYPGPSMAQGLVDYIADGISSRGARVLLPKNFNMSFGDQGYHGMGTYYIEPGVAYGSWIWGGISTIGTSMRLSGGLVPAPVGNLTPPTAAQTGNNQAIIRPTPATQQVTAVAEPIDALTGMYYSDSTDLSLGGAAPYGLELARHYSVGRRHWNPVGLGAGWTHNYDIRLNYRHYVDPDIERATLADVAPHLVALQVIFDVFRQEGSAKEWVVPALISCWQGEQLLNSRAAITMGNRILDFTRLPDGTFAPPSGVAASLTKTESTHTLKFRKGLEIGFNSDGKFTSITDKNNSAGTPHSLTASYTNGRLDSVTDYYNRTLTFDYDSASGRLTTVSDSTGRSVSYGLEPKDSKNAFTVTDTEGKKSWLFYDPQNRIYEKKDARERTVFTTFFDSESRAIEQRTFGETTKSWKYGYTGTTTRQVDPYGKVAWFTFDARGRKTSYSNERGFRSDWVYDGADRLSAMLTPKGHEWYFDYDSNHELTSVKNPYNHIATVTPENETSTNSRTITNFEGKSTTINYFSYHKVKDVTRPGGITDSYTYDSAGRPQDVHPAAFSENSKVSYDYTLTNGVPSKVVATFPDLTKEVFKLNARGECTHRIDRRGKMSSFVYNARGDVTSVTLWTGTYDENSQVSASSPAGSAVTTIAYDDVGDVDYIINSLGKRTDLDHDASGSLTSVAGHDAVVQSSMTYNNRGQLDYVSDALQNVSELEYYDDGSIYKAIDPLDRETVFNYDNNGNRTEVISQMQNAVEQKYNALELPDSVVDALTYPSGYLYDKDGRIKQLTNRLNKTFTWTYDDDLRKVVAKTPLQKTETTTLNTRGLVESIEEPSAQKMEITSFSAEGRPETVLLKNGATTVSSISLTHESNGLLKTVSEGTKRSNRTYDDFGRLKTYSDGEGNTLEYDYNLAGQITKIKYPGSDNFYVDYDYDDYGRLKEVEDSAGRKTTYTYDAAGRLTSILRPNETLRRLTYDGASQLGQIEELNKNGGVLWQQVLQYDGDGRIKRRFSIPTPQSFSLSDDDPSYDDDNRLSTWNGTAVTSDDDGNMTYGPLPNGSMGSYGYDLRNRLTSSGGVSYGYSVDGHRVDVSGVKYVVDPNAVLSRILVRNNGGALTRYVWGLGLIYEVTVGSGQTRTYHADHLGSTMALSDGDGVTVTDRFQYAPFGERVYRLGSTDTPFQFHGSLGCMSDSNGLVYMRARYYNPRTMRFLNADPIGFEGGMNWYAYCDGNPLGSVDPLGMSGQSLAAWGLPAFTPGPYISKEMRDIGTINMAMYSASEAIHSVNRTASVARGLYDNWEADVALSFGFKASGQFVDKGLNFGFAFSPYQKTYFQNGSPPRRSSSASAAAQLKLSESLTAGWELKYEKQTQGGVVTSGWKNKEKFGLSGFNGNARGDIGGSLTLAFIKVGTKTNWIKAQDSKYAVEILPPWNPPYLPYYKSDSEACR